jgi:hypothetical protein
MKIVEYKGDWAASALAEIAVWSARFCRYFNLLVAKGRRDEAMHLLHDLMPYLVARQVVNAWPGTVKLDGETCEMLKFEANQTTVEILVRKVLPALFLPEPLVEDFSMLRIDGRPWFVTITHERDAFFKLEPYEIDALTAAIGADNFVVQGDDELPEEKY